MPHPSVRLRILVPAIVLLAAVSALRRPARSNAAEFFDRYGSTISTSPDGVQRWGTFTASKGGDEGGNEGGPDTNWTRAEGFVAGDRIIAEFEGIGADGKQTQWLCGEKTESEYAFNFLNPYGRDSSGVRKIINGPMTWLGTSLEASFPRSTRVAKTLTVRNASPTPCFIFRVDENGEERVVWPDGKKGRFPLLIKKNPQYDTNANALPLVKVPNAKVGDVYIVRTANHGEYLYDFVMRGAVQTIPGPLGEWPKSPKPAYASMTEFASEVPLRRHPALIWLNFEGLNGQLKAEDAVRTMDLRTVVPFQPRVGSSDEEREMAIQEILFRTSELFSPFDVRVGRIGEADFWDKSLYGNTTVFIGGFLGEDGQVVENAVSYTPPGSSDYPYEDPMDWGDEAGPGNPDWSSHRPNSSPYDIALVHAGGGESAISPAAIATTVAHEVGHTFGLSHVELSKDDLTNLLGAIQKNYRSEHPDWGDRELEQAVFEEFEKTYKIWPRIGFDGKVSQGNDSSVNREIMHPHASGARAFKNVEYAIRATDPMKWKGEVIPTANSHAYLSAIHGRRPPDDVANVLDADLVSDPELVAKPLSSHAIGWRQIDYAGDYDVFALPKSTTSLQAWVSVGSNESLRLAVLVFDSSNQLTSFDIVERGAHLYGVRQGCAVVVGGLDSNFKGRYSFALAPRP